jgi:hypothetical protein
MSLGLVKAIHNMFYDVNDNTYGHLLRDGPFILRIPSP